MAKLKARLKDQTIYFTDVAALLDFVQHSGTAPLGPSHASAKVGEHYGQSLTDYLRLCQTGTSPDLARRAQEIMTLSESLIDRIPQGHTVRRERVWTRQGDSVNVHRVLRGNLSHAWRKTIRTSRLSEQGSLTLILPAGYSAYSTPTQVYWRTAATLALADYARRSGRQVEIWAVAYSGASLSKDDEVVSMQCCVPLVHAGQIWDITSVALTTYHEWLRRLIFRVLESYQGEWQLMSHYGNAMDGKTLLAWCKTYLAPRQGLNPDTMYLGCAEDTKVGQRPSAEQWLQAQLERWTHAPVA